MAFSEPLRAIPLKGPAAIGDGKAKERSFIVVGVYSGGPKTEEEAYETIRYTFIDGTAKFEEDFGPRTGGARSGTIRINFGGGTGAIFVPIIVDRAAENDEDFFIQFDRLNGSGESVLTKVTIVNRPPEEPAPLPPPPAEPAPPWWPPGFGQFDTEPEGTSSTSNSSEGGSEGSTGSTSSSSEGGSEGSTGSTSSSSAGGSQGSTGSTSSSSAGSSEGSTSSTSNSSAGGTQGTANQEARINELNERFDTKNIRSNDIVSRTRTIQGKEIEAYFVNMSKFGTPSKDNTGGSRLPDYINLLEDNDWFSGGRGDDEIYGQKGQDTLLGNQGNDFIVGNLDDDYVFGGKDNDHIYGKKGDDHLYGNRANDSIWGGSGNDHIYGGKNDDHIYGEQGDDKLYGNRAKDSIWAGEGNDSLYGNEDQDILWGNEGDDYLNGGKSDDILWGGGGADQFGLSKGLDVIKDFQATDGDTLKIPIETNFVLMEREGFAFLLTDRGSFLLEGVSKDAFDMSASTVFF